MISSLVRDQSGKVAIELPGRQVILALHCDANDDLVDVVAKMLNRLVGPEKLLLDDIGIDKNILMFLNQRFARERDKVTGIRR
ncbi:MAG: hypothetical protein ACU0C9_03990 [Paracoccaceae bacterium]